MNCQGFKRWLIDHDEFNAPHSDAAQAHVNRCHSCQRLYEADQSMEAVLKRGMQPVAPPPGLIGRARRRAESRSNGRLWTLWTRSWKAVTPAVATAVLLIVLVLNPFSAKRHSMDDVVAYSIANHLDAGMTMEFGAMNLARAALWFSKRLGYPVQLPDMTRRGLALVGGRKCRLGKIDAAYLFCDAGGKRVSLFLIHPDDVGFVVSEGREYSTRTSRYTVTVWKEAGMVCALVV